MRRTSFNHEFVDYVPDELEEGVLYVSMRYATATHRCACGCGSKIVTPLRPAPLGWQLLFDGKTVSLMPSIGNWQYPCRSHYFITSDGVEWVRDQPPERVIADRRRKMQGSKQYISERRQTPESTEPTDTTALPQGSPRRRMLVEVLRRLKLF